MKNLKISVKLAILVGVTSVLMLTLGVMGMVSNRSSAEALRTVYEDRTVPMGQLADLSYIVQRNRVLVMDMMLEPTPAHVASREREFTDNIAKASRVWDAYMATYLTDEEKVLAKRFADARAQYVNDGLKPTVALIRQGNLDGAKKLYETKISPMAKEVHEADVALTELQLRVAKEEYDAAVDRKETNFWITIALLVGSIGFGGFLGWTLSRGIVHSIDEAKDILLAVAGGDLTRTVTRTSTDEVGQMLAAVQTMQTSLTQLVLGVRNGSESVSTASAEIAQGNQDLSARTESQASALQETAASMEELSSTVRQNADNAHQAKQLAYSASTVAQQGGEVFGQVVTTMRGISDSSNKIADIIGVIDGIAFQTNILALNAAVEAARAGEQGRGFAVVAGEVRTLAGRSAQAAKEIKELITDSVSRVEQGTQLVDRAGSAMHEIVNSIQRVTDIMGEISAASSEQSSGVAQVGEAVTQMDQATQQNAALVEQMAAAASSLNAQAAELVKMVATFKLNANAAQVASSLPRATPRAPTPPVPRPAPAVSRPVAKPLKAPALSPKLPPKEPPVRASAESDEWESF